MVKAKNVDSLRQKSNNGIVIRLLKTTPLLDDKWIPSDIPRDSLKEYLVVRYLQSYEDYIAIWHEDNDNKTVIWWDKTTHDKIKSSIEDYDDDWDQSEKDIKKTIKSNHLFNEGITAYFHTDDFSLAQKIYIQWCKDHANIKVDELSLQHDDGDDNG